MGALKLVLMADASAMLAIVWLFVGALGLSVAPREWRSILLPAAMLAGALACFFGAT